MQDLTQRQHRRDSIKWLSEELRDAVFYVEDPELKQRVVAWLKRASRLPVGDMMDLIENHLTRLRRIRSDESDNGYDEYAMRRLEDDGEDDFPDSCKGCEHYGTRCPIFVDPVERHRRTRLQDEYANKSATEMRQAYRRYAEANGCHQIPAALTDWEDDYQELITEGWELYEAIDVDVGFTDEADEAAQELAEAERGGQ